MGDNENTTLRLLQQSHSNYCHDIVLEYFTTIDRAQQYYTYVPLETAIASFSIGMNLLVSIVVVGTNLKLYTILQYSDVQCMGIFCNKLHYVAILCDILHMRYY